MSIMTQMHRVVSVKVTEDYFKEGEDIAESFKTINIIATDDDGAKVMFKLFTNDMDLVIGEVE